MTVRSAAPAAPARSISPSISFVQPLSFAAVEWLPTDPPRPAPALMTAVEAAIYLRLDLDRDIGDAIKSLEYLIAQGWLRPTRVGRSNRYARVELNRFMHEQTERYGQEDAT